MKVCDSPLHRDARAEGVVIFGVNSPVCARASGQCVLSASGKSLTATSVMALENYRTYSKPDTVSPMCLGKTDVAKDSSFISNLAYQY